MQLLFIVHIYSTRELELKGPINHTMCFIITITIVEPPLRVARALQVQINRPDISIRSVIAELYNFLFNETLY